MMNKDTFTVPRSTWARGGGSVESNLLDIETRHRCCLGHVGDQCGIPDASLLDQMSPGTMFDDFNDAWPVALRPVLERKEVEDSLLARNMMGINDARVDTPALLFLPDGRNMSITIRSERERENLLAALAATAGILITFVD